MELKVKSKFDKFSIRGLVYMGVAGGLLAYEMLTHSETRLLLFVGYGVIFIIGLVCLLFISEND